MQIQQKQIAIKNFASPSERVIEEYVSLIGLYALIRDSVIVNEKGKISGNNEYDFWFRTRYHDGCVLNEFCNEKTKMLLEDIRITIDNKTYCLRQEHDGYHKENEGGENVTYTFLESDKKPILMSLKYLSYLTSSFSDEDYNERKITRTELIDQNDTLAGLIFEEIKRLKRKAEESRG